MVCESTENCEIWTVVPFRFLSGKSSYGTLSLEVRTFVRNSVALVKERHDRVQIHTEVRYLGKLEITDRTEHSPRGLRCGNIGRSRNRRVCGTFVSLCIRDHSVAPPVIDTAYRTGCSRRAKPATTHSTAVAATIPTKRREA